MGDQPDCFVCVSALHQFTKTELLEHIATPAEGAQHVRQPPFSWSVVKRGILQVWFCVSTIANERVWGVQSRFNSAGDRVFGLTAQLRTQARMHTCDPQWHEELSMAEMYTLLPDIQVSPPGGEPLSRSNSLQGAGSQAVPPSGDGGVVGMHLSRASWQWRWLGIVWH